MIDAPDLVTIGDDAVISDNAMIATSSVERGLLRLGPVEIGPRASVGTMGIAGRGSRIGAGAALDGLSALANDAVIPAGELWAGSPARPTGQRSEAGDLAVVSPMRSAMIRLALAIGAFLLPIVAILPISPGLIMMIELDWNSEGYSYLLVAPLLATTYVLLMCLITVFAKHLIMGKVAPGRYSLASWFYVRFWFVQQINDLALNLLHPIYATLFVVPWYRALGVKVGRRAEISTAAAIVPDLVEIGPESFIADDVNFGAARVESGAILLERTKIGRRSFIGNSALLPAGSTIGDDVLIGVLSRPPAGGEAAASGGTWFGSPPIALPQRQQVALFDEGARFNPSRRLIATRLAIESVRVILSLTVFIALFVGLLSIVGSIDDGSNGPWLIALSFPFLYIGFALGCGLFVVALKWLIIGRYRQTVQPLWSPFVWRTELVTSTYENLAVPNLLLPLRGTPWLAVYLRLLGSKIGKRCFFDSADLTEYDLVTIGDDVAINELAGVQTHLFEDRVMKVGPVTIGDRVTIGSHAVVLYDAELGDDAQLGDMSVVMKGEFLPPRTSWEGSPARLASGH